LAPTPVEIEIAAVGARGDRLQGKERALPSFSNVQDSPAGKSLSPARLGAFHEQSEDRRVRSDLLRNALSIL